MQHNPGSCGSGGRQPTNTVPTPTFDTVHAHARVVIKEVASKTVPDDETPSRDLLDGLAGVFTELEGEYHRLREVLGLPKTAQADKQALRTAFEIYVEAPDYEAQLKPGEELPPGIVNRNWASYYQPHPHGDVLKNKLDITDANTLTDLDFSLSALRAVELMTGARFDDRPATDETLCAIHHDLFQDLYDWAGKHRIVNMSKGDTASFADTHTGEIFWFMSAVHHMSEIAPWRTIDRATFTKAMAAIFAYLNYAHPFREGNGRATRMLLRAIAARSPFRLQFARTSPDRWIEASAYSAPTDTHPMPSPAPLVPIFEAITIGPDGEANAEAPLVFDLEAIWPELTTELTPDQVFILNECLTDIWLEGWVPLPDLPQRLAYVLSGRLSAEDCRAQLISAAQGAKG